MGTTSKLRNCFTMGRSYDCSLRDITIQNGDVTWGATLGWNGYGKNNIVENVKFDNLILCSVNPDHSTVYVGCPFSEVRYCHFKAYTETAKLIVCTVGSLLNLFEMNFASVTNCSFDIRLRTEDTSMYSIIAFPSSCSLSYSSVIVHADLHNQSQMLLYLKMVSRAGQITIFVIQSQ